MKTIIIGIAGGTGSGKTTLTEKLRDHFGANEVSVLNHDSYYKRHDELPYEERCKLNYDHPDSFDTPLMVAHLRELRAGHPRTGAGLRLHHPQPQRQDRDRAARTGHYRGGDPDF